MLSNDGDIEVYCLVFYFFRILEVIWGIKVEILKIDVKMEGYMCL